MVQRALEHTRDFLWAFRLLESQISIQMTLKGRFKDDVSSRVACLKLKQ